MSSCRIGRASIRMPLLLVIGWLCAAQTIDSALAGKSAYKSRESARSYVLEGKRVGRGPRIPLPIGPSYIYYDYPYYYSRGYYPTHIGGYVYYPSYRRARYARRTGRCSSACIARSTHSPGFASARRQRGACKCH